MERARADGHAKARHRATDHRSAGARPVPPLHSKVRLHHACSSRSSSETYSSRWNYLLRTKNHTVEMPFLLPAPEFTPHQLQEQRITGTCEVQICRSVGPWSMGISHVEHSIQNAYCESPWWGGASAIAEAPSSISGKAIQLSDHFVYIGQHSFTHCSGL